MFKVECLGCQAPYQVDERRIPEKGLKMRCPKCGTSFRVEPPAHGLPAPAAAPASPSQSAPAATEVPPGFGPAAISRGLAPGKAPSARDALARTMIGVSAADLETLKGPAAAPPRKAFRVPRPNAAEEASSEAQAATPEPFAFGAFSEGAELSPELDVGLPVVVGVAGRQVAGSSAAEAASDPSYDVARESLGGPNTPSNLSELPLPVVVSEGSIVAAGGSAHRQDDGSAEEFSPGLDLGDELPALVSPQRPPPPPRRARAQPASPRAAAPVPEDTLDLPARIEDLEAGLPNVVGTSAPAARGRATTPRETESGSEIGLPAPLARKAPPAPPAWDDGLDLPASPRHQAPTLADFPAVARTAPRAPAKGRPSFGDLPDVPGAAMPATAAPGTLSDRGLPDGAADLPAVIGAGLPDVLSPDLPAAIGAGLPDVLSPGLPEVSGAGLPDVLSSGLPEVSGAGLPDVLSPGLPAVAAGLPQVASVPLPAVSGAGLPQVVEAGLPVVGGPGLPAVGADLPASAPTGLPEIAGRGVAGFGRVDLPVAREAGLPEIQGLGEVDLPGVGESLPMLADDDVFADAHLPLVGDALPATKGARAQRVGDLPAGFDADGDPFGAAAAEDPFGADGELDFGAMDDPFGAERLANEPSPGSSGPASTGGYGELDLGGVSEGSLDTADDADLHARSERESLSTARAAAAAAVHEASDAEATGSTLELGPERRTVTRDRTRRLAIAGSLCAALVAGGALALEPALGPFGFHFILDRVKQSEHEQALVRLVGEGRESMARDTFEASREAIGELEAARRRAPRFEPLQARYAFANFAAALRFGPLPKLEAAGKAAVMQLDTESGAAGHRLARAAQAAVLESAEAKQLLEALGDDPDARLLRGELAEKEKDFETASALWKELLKQHPDHVRAAFGIARAELGLGRPAAARTAAEQVLKLSPGHVGARILMLEASRAVSRAGGEGQAQSGNSEALLAAVAQVLPQASPGEAALAHSVMGELHLNQGRSEPARRAFEEALALDRNFGRALLGLGETLYLGGRHSEALARFQAAAQADAASFAAQIGVAKCQIQLTKLPEAKAVLAKVREKHPNHPEIIYWSSRAEQAIGNTEAALLGYRAAIDAQKGRPESVGAYLSLAKLQSELGQLAQAQQTLSEAKNELPPNGELHNALGELALNRGRYLEAYREFQRAEEIDPGDTRARFWGAVALTRLGRFDEALAAFQRVSDTDKEFPGLAVERGRLFEESGRSEEALKEYEAALAGAPEDLELKVRVGCARLLSGRAAQAQELLDSVVKDLPRSAEAWYCLGRTLFELDQNGEAIHRLERAVQLDASRPVYHLYLGWALAEVGRHGDAETALAEALELDKGLADALWQRGRLRLKQGAVKDAIKDLERALEIKPSRIEARADLAVAYADLGRIPQAIGAWEEALSRDPDNATWHYRYGKLLSSSGRANEAAAHLRRAIELGAPRAAAPGASPPQSPPWLWQAHYLLARELGPVGAAVLHWQAYLRLAPPDDPYRREAIRALEALGQPWEER